MALKEVAYSCAACGKPGIMRLKEEEVPRRRYLLTCVSKKCRGKKQFFYPIRRPITGAYR